jgi:hypothetical protein
VNGAHQTLVGAWLALTRVSTQVDTCLKSDSKSQESPQLEAVDLKSDRAHSPCAQVWLESGEPDSWEHRRHAF